MKNLPVRFENAVVKLYKAYHNGSLRGSDCTKCAVGNICDNSGMWFTPISSVKCGAFNKAANNAFIENNDVMIKSGYSPNELANIETIFLNTMHLPKSTSFWRNENKETQFEGLCAVIEYLCELDNIPNIMDYTQLFETENNVAKYELELLNK